jgi:hypothetical protein
MSSAGSARSFYCHGGTARGPRLAAGAVGELGSARSPGAVGRKKHGFRSGFGRRGSCSCSALIFRTGSEKERNFSATGSVS